MKPMMRTNRVRMAALIVGMFALGPAMASETITYTYDSRGRLVQTSHGGSVNNGILACYQYDRADNRQQVDVKNSGTCPPTSGVSFLVNDVSVTEGGNLVFTVAKTGTTTSTVSVNYATADGIATAGASGDYTAQSGTLTFLAAQASMTVSVPTINDTAFEPAETLYLNLSNVTAGGIVADDQATGTINDNEGFSISDDADQEGRGLSFTITKNGTALSSIVVTYATSDGTAIAGSDYSAVSGSAIFSPSDTTKTVYVNTTSDAAPEQNETFFMKLTGASPTGTILDDTGTGTINDDDQPPSFSVNDISGPESSNFFTFTITRTGLTSGSHSVSFSATSGTSTGAATANADFYPVTGTVTFSGNETKKTWSVQIFEDTLVEGTEKFNFNLSNPTGGATISDALGIGTITDNDTAGGTGCSTVRFSVADARVFEGNPIVFTITRTGSASISCSVGYATADGSAIAPNDYAATTGSATFTPTQTSKTVSIPTVLAGPNEPQEFMYLNLTSASDGGGWTDGQAKGVIDNNSDGCITCLQLPPPP
jgi:large repetitive protein